MYVVASFAKNDRLIPWGKSAHQLASHHQEFKFSIIQVEVLHMAESAYHSNV